MSAELKDLVEHIVCSLVDDPEAVEVTDVADEIGSVLEVRVAQPDLGKVIGKRGNTARAIRTVLAAAATKSRARAVLNILED